jgi:hypothetical protein
MAARCHNRATPEYKALLQEFKTNIATDNVITSWQDLNNTNEFPTVSQAQEFLKQYKTSESLRKREFAEALLSNLSRLGYAKAGKNGYYVTNSNQPGGIFDENVLNSNRNKIINYLMMNNIPVDSVSFSDTTKGETYFISIDDASLSQRDILPKRRGFDEPKTVKILNHLNNLFPELNIQIATIQEARNYYDSLDPAMKANVKFEDVKSFYVRGKVYLVRGRVTDNTAIEEVLHPFVDALFIQNRALFDNLLKEARTNFPELNREINRVYSEMNGFTQEERDLELVTQSLTRHFADEYEKAPTKTFMDRIREFLEWFKTVINDFHKYLTGVTIRRADQIVSATTPIKPGVAELFESNPKLATSVYEALGFTEKKYADKLKGIAQRRSLATKEDLEKSQLIKDLVVNESQPNELKPNKSDKNLAAIMLYGERYDDLSDTRTSEEDFENSSDYKKSQSELLAYRILNNLMFDVEELAYYEDIIKQYPEYASTLSTNENPVKDFFENDIFEQAEKEKFEITSKQKQQAQQLYSQYLDTIFPDSKVKDIVYHGTNSKFDKFVIPERTFSEYDDELKKMVQLKGKGAAYFTDKKSLAEQSGKSKKAENVLSAVINLKNPKETTSQVGVDDNIINLRKSFDGYVYTNIKANYIVQAVFEPEQIHILGNQEDIEGFKEFASKEIQVTPTLAVGEIKPIAKLTDIAKLLNTSMFKFDLQTEDSLRVRYALSDRKQKLVDKALDSSNEVQKNVINRLFGIARTRDESIDSLSANIYSPYEDSSIVVLNKADHTYIDITTGDIYTSVTTAIKGKLKNEEDVQLNVTLGNDFDFIMDGIVSNMTLKDILESGEIKILNEEQVERAFNDLQEKIQDLRSDGSVAISQVVLFDQATKIAGTADLVLITPQGKLKILDLKTSKSWYATMREEYDKEWNLDDDSVLKSRGIADKLSTRQQHNLQVNLYRRMAENMGYDVATDEYATSTYHIHVDITGKGKEQKFEGTFEVDGWVPHPPSQNSVYVDKLIPVDYMNRDPEMTAARLGLDSPEDFDPDNFLDPEEQLPEDLTDENDYTEFNTIFNALNQYKTGLLNRRQAIERIKSGIFMDRRTEQIIENIDNTVGAIMVAMSEGGALVSSTYTDLLRDAIKEVDQFTEYMLDPLNFDKNEYINYALNFDRFLVTFNGLTEIQKSDAVNATQAKLLLTLETKLRSLGGTKTKTGIIDAAIMNYVKETVRNTSSRNFTEAELDELMRTAKDIGILDLGTRDLATSTDTLLAIMDKIYKAKKQELYDKIDARNEEIINAANKLLKLSPTSNRNEIYDFMLEFDDQGGFTGRYVKALGKQYYDKIDKLRAELFDEEGNWKEYREIDDLRTAKKEDIDYNKALYKAKQAYTDFWRAETIGTNDNPIDGEYHGYTSEFKEARAKHEVFVAEGKHGYWVRKRGISDKAYLNYKLKYFDTFETKFAVKKDGVFTGKVTDGTIQVPKVKYRFAREISSKGEDMRNAKYTAIMNPTDALGEARKEFYEVYVKNFENDLLNKLPTGVRDQMLGRVPLVQSNLVNSLKEKGNLFTKLWSKTTRSVRNLTTETSHMRRVVVDETGQFVDTLPIFYVGNTRDDQALEILEAKLDQLNKERKMGAVNAIEYKKQSMELNGKITDIKNKPATNEISRDMGDSLLKFSAMAEHYETMGAIEDTMNAFLYVIENRQYESAEDNVTRIARYGKENIKVFQKKGSTEANVITRAKKFMSMVYYDSDEITKGKWDKISDFIINTSSMTYVAFNPFGNINNYVMGRLNNNIELLGQRFFTAKSGLRATQEFNKRALPDVAKRFGMHGYKLGMGGQYDPTKPMSKYEGFVDMFRMMDTKSDIRETRGSTAQKSWFESFFIEKLGYGLQDAAEYNVQTKVGMAMVMDTILKNKTTGETLSLYDAAEFDSVTHKLKFKDGFDTIVKKNGVEVAFDDKFRYDLRNRIREVNKQIHGNYAREDRMVIQANALGRLAAQFHKWVAPAIRARFGREYFDENLGWMEGRYKSFWQFMGYFFRNLDKVEMTGKIIGPKMKEGFLKDYGYKGDGSQDDAKAENKLYNMYRTLGELGIIISIMVVREILGGMLSGDDDDNETIKRLENAILFQADRSVKEMKTFIPVIGFTDMYQMAKSPVASTRTLAEWGQALGSTMLTGYNGVKYMATDNPEYWEGNKDIVYQRKPDKGNLKMAKEWKDAIPILYTFQRWASYDTVSDFYIK